MFKMITIENTNFKSNQQVIITLLNKVIESYTTYYILSRVTSNRKLYIFKVTFPTLRLTSWCQDNCLSFWMWEKLKLIVDFRRDSSGPTLLYDQRTPVERVTASSTSLTSPTWLDCAHSQAQSRSQAKTVPSATAENSGSHTQSWKLSIQGHRKCIDSVHLSVMETSPIRTAKACRVMLSWAHLNLLLAISRTSTSNAVNRAVKIIKD